jgi:AcrR family transcriptional regulator
MSPNSSLSVRDQIVETASRLFLTQGYNQTGINQIIEEAGIAKASLYYHFSSKEDLCVEYLRNRAKIWREGLENYLVDITDPRERIIKTFDYRKKFMEESRFNGCSYIRIVSEIPQEDNKVHQQAIAIKEMHRAFFQVHAEQIEGMTAEEKTDLANTLLLLFDGGSIQCMIYKNSKPLVDAKKAVIATLARH